ncbi:MAG: hypothetical protein ACR2NM_05640 [Bythopirellula sp.]
MLAKSTFALLSVLGIILTGCQTPYGGCAGGCCGGTCGVGAPSRAVSRAAYSPVPSTYVPAQQAPSTFQGGGSGTR